MPNFTVRMVLHTATRDDYEKLASEMANRGYVDTIVGSSGTTYTLPDAEYVGDAGSIDIAFEEAKAAAEAVGKKYAIFITECKTRKWVGLKKA